MNKLAFYQGYMEKEAETYKERLMEGLRRPINPVVDADVVREYQAKGDLKKALGEYIKAQPDRLKNFFTRDARRGLSMITGRPQTGLYGYKDAIQRTLQDKLMSDPALMAQYSTFIKKDKKPMLGYNPEADFLRQIGMTKEVDEISDKYFPNRQKIQDAIAKGKAMRQSQADLANKGVPNE